jgi:hypothetical protein
MNSKLALTRQDKHLAEGATIKNGLETSENRLPPGGGDWRFSPGVTPIATVSNNELRSRR